MNPARALALGLIFVLSLASGVSAQATRPTTRPAGTPSPKSLTADEMLGQMLKPGAAAPKVLQPSVDAPMVDRTSGAGSVKPAAPTVALTREGTYLADRLGRLTHPADGSQAEFVFEADGKTMHDPPVIILPSLKLMAMESAVSGASRDLKFRISGSITEYRGRNYILLEKVVVVPDVVQQF